MINYVYYGIIIVPVILMAICIYGISIGWADDVESKDWKHK